MSGAGLLALSGLNTYSGGTTLNGGTLQLGNASALGAAGLTLNAGVIDLASFSPTVTSLSGSASTIITNSGAADATLTVNQSGTTSFGGALSDGPTNKMALALSGGGLTLSGSNTYSGTTTITNGQLYLASSSAIPISGNVVLGSVSDSNSPGILTTQNNQFGAGTVMSFVNIRDSGGSGWTHFQLEGTQQALAGISDSNGAGIVENSETGVGGTSQLTLSPAATASYSFDGLIRNATGTIGLAFTGPGAQTLSGGNIQYTGSTSVSGGTLTLQNTGNFASSSIAISGRGALIFNPGTGGLNSVYSGSTSVSGGTLTLQDTRNFVSAITVGASGTLNLVRSVAGISGKTAITGPISGDGTINVNNSGSGTSGGWVTFIGSAGLNNFTGTIHGSQVYGTDGAIDQGILALAKVGPGTLILSGSNSYIGGTDVQDGTLAAASSDAIPPGSGLTVESGGTVVFGDLSEAGATMVARSSLAGVAAVPEPDTLALLAVGAMAAMFGVWRRKKS